MEDENKTPEATTVNDAPEKTEAEKDYAKLYENSKSEIARKEAKYKADIEAMRIEKEELEAYRKEKATREEKDKISKGKQNEVIEEYKKKFEDIEPEFNKYKSYYEKEVERKTLKVTEQLEAIPETEREFVSNILSKTNDVDEKLDLLKGLNDRFWIKKDRWKEPWEKKPPEKLTDFEALQEKKKNGKLSPSEKIKYLSLLSKQ